MSHTLLSTADISSTVSGDLWFTGKNLPMSNVFGSEIPLYSFRKKASPLSEVLMQQLSVVIVLRSFGCCHTSVQCQKLISSVEDKLLGLGANLVVIGRGSRAMYDHWLKYAPDLECTDYYYFSELLILEISHYLLCTQLDVRRIVGALGSATETFFEW